MTQQDRAGQVHTYASDIRPGDVVSVRGEPDAFKVATRTYPGITSPTFRVECEDGTRRTLGKLSMVAIEDPDGRVASRIIEIHIRAATNAAEDGL